MSTQVQLRRGNTSQTSTITGAVAEITVDTDKKTLVVHDGTTAGGIVGSVFTVTCISTTQWVISGVLQASGVAALTPATS